MRDVTIRLLTEADRGAMEAFLRPRLVSSMFLLSNIAHGGFDDRGEVYDGTYAAAFEGDRMVAVVGHNWMGGLVLQAPVHAEALSRVAMRVSRRELYSIVGPADQVDGLAAALGVPLEGEVVQMNDRERLYALPMDEVVWPSVLEDAGVVGRRLCEADREPFFAMMRGYLGEESGMAAGERMEAKCAQYFECGCAEPEKWVLEVDGELVAMAGFNAQLPEAVQLGGVYTVPAHRGKGYGRAAVASALRYAKGAGVSQSLLFVNEDNTPAIRAYESLGYQTVGDYRVMVWAEPVGV